MRGDSRCVTALLFLIPTSLLASIALYSVAPLGQYAYNELCGESHGKLAASLNALSRQLSPPPPSAAEHAEAHYVCALNKVKVSVFTGLEIGSDVFPSASALSFGGVCDTLRSDALPFTDCQVAQRTVLGAPVLSGVPVEIEKLEDGTTARVVSEQALRQSSYLKGLEHSPIQLPGQEDGIDSETRFRVDKHVQVMVYRAAPSEGNVLVESAVLQSCDAQPPAAAAAVTFDASGSVNPEVAATQAQTCEGRQTSARGPMAVLSSSSAIVFVPSSASVVEQRLVAEAVRAILQVATPASAAAGVAVNCSQVPHAHIAALRVARALQRYADLCDALHVTRHGTTSAVATDDHTADEAEERGAALAGGNLFLHPWLAEAIREQYGRIQSLIDKLRPANFGAASDDLASVRESSLLLTAASRIASHPSIAYDHYIPFLHRLAIYLPPWAPVVMPILLAVIVGIRRVAAANKAARENAKAGTGTQESKPGNTNLFDEDRVYTLTPRPERLAGSPSAAGGITPTNVRNSVGSNSNGKDDGSSPAAANPVHLRVRALQPGDTRALQSLYVLGQLQHVRDNYRLLPKDLFAKQHQASSSSSDDGDGLFGGEDGGLFWRAHERWTDFVLGSDLKDPYQHYVEGEQKGQYPGKANFWVATVSREDFERFPASGTSATAGLEQLVRKARMLRDKLERGDTEGMPAGISKDSTQMRFILGGGEDDDDDEASLARMLGSDLYLDAEGRVVVGTIAVTPWTPDSTHSSSSSTQSSLTEEEKAAEERRKQQQKRETPVAELIRMCVHARIHRCGLASTLLRHLEEWCRRPETGYKQIYLGTLSTMVAGVALYRANGYDYGMPGQGLLPEADKKKQPVFGSGEKEEDKAKEKEELPFNPARGRREIFEGDEIFVVELVKDISGGSQAGGR